MFLTNITIKKIYETSLKDIKKETKNLKLSVLFLISKVLECKTHTDTQTLTPKPIYSNIHTDTHTHTLTQTHTLTHSHTHKHIHKHINTRTNRH